MTPADKLRVATSFLILHHPFIATPLLRLKLVPDPRRDTAAVDGRSIFYNEDFVDGLTFEKTIFLLAHEVLHVALAHHLRRGDRHKKGWNAAADFVINLTLKEAGFALIPGALLDPAYAGWSTERVYRALLAQAQEARAQALRSPSGNPTPSGEEPDLGDFLPQGEGGAVEDLKSDDGRDLSQAERSLEEGKLLVTLKQALQLQSLFPNSGSLLPCFSRAVASRFAGFDARNELGAYLETVIGRDDYTWSRLNPRYLPAGFSLPSLSASRALDVVVAIDTSGSIDESVLGFMAGVCEDLLAAFPQILLRVVYCDSAVRSNEELTIHDCPLVLRKAMGGGLTRFDPVFDWVAAEGWQPAVLLYLTDLMGPTPKDPGYPV